MTTRSEMTVFEAIFGPSAAVTRRSVCTGPRIFRDMPAGTVAALVFIVMAAVGQTAWAGATSTASGTAEANLQGGPPLLETRTIPARRLTEAIRDARGASDDRARQDLAGWRPSTSEEVRILHSELLRVQEEVRPSSARPGVVPPGYAGRMTMSECLNAALVNAGPGAQDEVISLLGDEISSLPADYAGYYGATTESALYFERVRTDRIRSLSKASVTGDRRRALPVLRRVATHDPTLATIAVPIVTEIADPQDVDSAIRNAIAGTVAVPLASFRLKDIALELRKALDDPTLSEDSLSNLIGNSPIATSTDAVDFYVSLLSHKSPTVVEGAAARLVTSTVSVPEQAVTRLLTHEQSRLRSSGIHAVSHCRTPANFARIRHMLLHDPEWTIRATAATALADLHDMGARGALNAALEDPDQRVRAHAAEALRNLQ